jgi:hypothetical protein
MKVLIEVKRRVIDNVKPNIIGMCLGAEFESVGADEFVINLYFDE